jgi:hypothetical protein
MSNHQGRFMSEAEMTISFRFSASRIGNLLVDDTKSLIDRFKMFGALQTFFEQSVGVWK